MRSHHWLPLGCACWLAIPFAHGELLIQDSEVPPQYDYYEHPVLRSLVFISSESRGQAILPPVPVFVMTPPLMYRAPDTFPPFPPPVTLPGFNRTDAPGNREMSHYNLARAHAYLGHNLWVSGHGGYASPYPSVPIGLPPPGNRDNSFYLVDHARHFRHDGPRKP